MQVQYYLIDYLISAVLALIMFGLGLSLTIEHFKKIFLFPKALITGLLTQVILIPFIAFIVAEISGLPNEMKIGLIIISVCASGASSNLITYLFKGNVALAISMTAINSLLTLATVPLIVNLALLVFAGHTEVIKLPFWETIRDIFNVTILPAALGVLVRMKWPVLSHNAEKWMKYTLPVLLGLVFTVKIFAGHEHGGTGITFNESLHIFPFALLLNSLAMMAGFYSARKMKCRFADQFTIGIEVGLHNTALALLIAGTILHNANMQKPAIVYAAFSFFTAVLFAWLIKSFFSGKKNRPGEN